MICGNCKERDVAVAHVRGCYAAKHTPAPKEVRATLDLLGNVEEIEGIYLLDGTYVKVQIGTDTGRAYCKVWETPLGDGNFEWTYQGRAPLHRLTLSNKVTAD